MAFDLGVVRGALELRDSFVSVLNNAEQRITGFGQRVDSELKRTEDLSNGLDHFGKTATGAGLALSAGLTAPLALIGGAVAKLGIDAVESRNLMEVSFGNMIGDADSWAGALSKDLGLNRFEMEKTAGTMFNMVSSMGLGKQAAFDVSTGIVKLAADMASFRNIPIEDALQKLQSGLTGETEPLKRIGILVDDNTIKQYAYQNGIAKVGAELSQQQKVLARYGAILQQTSNDQGDLARTMESPANQLRIMQSRIQEAATKLGESFVPIVSEAISVVSRFVPVIQGAVDIFADLPGPVQGSVIAIAALAAAAGPALVIAGQLAIAWKNVGPILEAAGGASSILAKSLSILGPAAAVVATAFAAWEVGKWLGEWSGLTDWVERLSGRLMGLSSAQIEAGMAARKSAEAAAQHSEATQKAAASTEELNAHLKQEAENQNQAATSTNLAAEATKLAEKRAKEHADALREVNEKIASAIVMNNNMTDTQIKQAESYKTLGLSIQDIALKMGVAETAVQHYFDVTKKSVDTTKELWTAHYDAVRADSQLASETQRDAIQRWFDHEVSLLDKSDKNYKAHYDALAATAQDKLNAISKAWESVKEKSIEAQQEELRVQQEVYNKMLTSGKHFSQEVLDEQRKKIQDLKDKLQGMGDAGKKAFDNMTEAAKNNTSAMIKAAEEADKARKANQAMGGSFEITRENFAASARGLGYDPGAVEQLLKKGYSFQQALLWSKHTDWPPPEHPGPRVQGFAEGGIVTVGEHGPERVALPWNSMVLPNGRDFDRAAGDVHITVEKMTVNGSGRDVAKEFEREIMSRLKMRKLVPVT